MSIEITRGTVPGDVVSAVSWKRHNAIPRLNADFLEDSGYVFWYGRPSQESRDSGIVLDNGTKLEQTEYKTTRRSHCFWYRAPIKQCKRLEHSDKTGRRRFSCTQREDGDWDVEVTMDTSLQDLPWLKWLEVQVRKHN